MARKKSIKLSPKHGLNPSILHCECCGKDYGLALLGKLKDDEEAPREIYSGLCDSCKGVIDSGGVMIIEVKDGEKGHNPYRTGRIVGVTKEFKDRNNLSDSIMYMEESLFSSIFADVEFQK